MRSRMLVLTMLVLLLPFIMGCMYIALRLSPDVYTNFTSSFFEECDPIFAGNSIPANLKMLEGLLKSDPENRYILTALSTGFCGYSLLFVEKEDPARASLLYRRSRDFGLKALGKKVEGLLTFDGKAAGAAVSKLGAEDFEPFFWMTVSWISYINLNLDEPSALAQLGNAEKCLDRLLEINPEYLHGLPYLLKAVMLSARPSMLGGDYNKAAQYFEKALALSDRRFFMAQYYYARYYAVGTQNKELFTTLVDEVFNHDPKLLKDVCLINSVVHEDLIRRLRKDADDLFF